MRAAVISMYIVLLAVLQGVAQPVEFTLEDRDRIIRTEVKLEEFQKQMEIQFQSVQTQFGSIQTQFDGVQTQFDGVQTQFGSIQTQFDGVQTQFDAIQVQFDGVQVQFDNIQVQFDYVQRQFDDLRTFLYWAFGIVIGMIGSLFAFIIWDRRTTLGPILRSQEELKNNNRQMLYVAREYALKDPDYRKIMKNASLL